MMKAAGLLAVLLALTSPAFAQKACTEIGCVNGATFTTPTNFDWKSGQYRIDLALDYKTVTCYGELPLNDCEDGPTFRCDDPDVTIQESGCALPQNRHGIAGIQINDDPNKIMVSIKRNLKPIITQTVVPQYRTVAPNGEGCGPVCKSASYNLLIAE